MGRRTGNVTRWLEPSCLSHALSKNLRPIEVACACLPSEIADLIGGSVASARLPAPAAATPPLLSRLEGVGGGAWSGVDLLVVDAEGHDDRVLQTYPFVRWPPRRLIFEPKHLPSHRFANLTRHLRGHGYECLEVLRSQQQQGANSATDCSGRGGKSTWLYVRTKAYDNVHDPPESRGHLHGKRASGS